MFLWKRRVRLVVESAMTIYVSTANHCAETGFWFWHPVAVNPGWLGYVPAFVRCLPEEK